MGGCVEINPHPPSFGNGRTGSQNRGWLGKAGFGGAPGAQRGGGSPSDGAGVVLGQLAELLLLGVALVAGDHQRVGVAHGHLGQGQRGN